jgi:hypothetical protein
MVARFQTLFSVVSSTRTDSMDTPSTELQRHATNTYEKMKSLVLKRYGYDAVLGTVRGHAVEKSLRILKPKSNVVSLIGLPDAIEGCLGGQSR